MEEGQCEEERDFKKLARVIGGAIVRQAGVLVTQVRAGAAVSTGPAGKQPAYLGLQGSRLQSGE